LICNTEQRLGKGGADEIKRHPFFAGVDFGILRSINAPFLPRLTSNVDTAYFPIDTATHLKAAQAQQVANGQPLDEVPEISSLPFIGYTFKRFDNNFK